MQLHDFARRATPLLRGLLALLEEAATEGSSDSVLHTSISQEDRRSEGVKWEDVRSLLIKRPGMTTAELASALHDPNGTASLDLTKRRVAVVVSYQHKKHGVVRGERVKGQKDLLWYVEPRPKTAEARWFDKVFDDALRAEEEQKSNAPGGGRHNSEG